LLIEDSEPDALLLVETLRRHGYRPEFERVQTEDSLRAALAKQRWDVIFCDYNMPQFNATSAFKVFRESRNTMPFIIVSGSIGEDRAVEALKSGIDDFVLKRNLDQVVPALKRSLNEVEHRRLRDAARYMNELIMTHSLDMICTIDAQFRFVEVSAASARLLGYEPQELEGRKFTQFMHPADLKRTQQEADAVMKGQSVFNFENRYIRKDGLAAYLSWSASWSSADRLLFCVARDITDQKLSEETLRQSEAMFRLVIEHVVDYAIVMLAPNGKIKTWNAGAERTQGYKAGEIIGQSFSRFFTPEDVSAGKPAELLKQAATDGRVAQEGWRLRKNGSRFWVSMALTAIRDARGELCGFSQVTHDLTERKKVEEERQLMELQLRQAQKLEAIGQLAAGIAHEINTPAQFTEHNLKFLKDAFPQLIELTHFCAALPTGSISQQHAEKIQSISQKTDFEFLEKEIPAAIDEALQGTERINKIVRAMKEFSHPGNLENRRPEPAKLNHAIETTITVARNEWKNVAEMITEFDSSLPLVPVFAGEFNQVILNLIVNATHAIAQAGKNTPGLKGIITVSTRLDGAWVEVRVRDNGTGIQEKDRHHIFEPFFTTKEVGKGTGQGLTLAHSIIVKKHAGELRFETETGKGTCFIIRLPLGQLAERPPEANINTGVPG
jgi:PAS domain S-box-containing protein